MRNPNGLVLLVLLGNLAGCGAEVNQRGDTLRRDGILRVYVLVQPLEAGDPLTRDHLRQVQVVKALTEDRDLVTDRQIDRYLGQPVQRPVPRGHMLKTTAFTAP